MTTLTTERLLLRPLDVETDVDAMVAYKSLPDVVCYVPYRVQTRADVVARFDDGSYGSELGGPGTHMSLGMVRRDTGDLIGDVLLVWTSETHRSGEIGYVMHPDHYGRGFATEACNALLRHAFDELQRLGMRAEARLVENEWFKGEWTTEVGYAILAREWRAAQP